MEHTEYGIHFTETADGARTALISGILDTGTSPDFLAEMNAQPAASRLTLDFSDVEYISSAGIRAVVVLAKQYGARFAVINVGEAAMEVFVTTGLTKILPISAMPAAQPEPMTFPAVLAAAVKKHPDKTFLRDGGRDYTYCDLDRASDVLAGELSARGVKRFSHVGILAEDSFHLLAAFFAVQKCGAVAAMLNPAYTVPELVALSVFGDVTHLLAGCVSAEKFDDFAAAVTAGESLIRCVLPISRDVDLLGREPAGYPRVDGDPDDPSVMIFTSGSTGTPKGALHSFRSLWLGGRNMITVQGTTDRDVLCHTLPLFHIGGICFDLMNALLSGASICIPETVPGSNIVSRMTAILDTVGENRCTLLNCVPTTLLSIAGLPTFKTQKIKTVRAIATGSQPITERQMDILTGSYQNAVIAVFYGMTEIMPATVVTSRDTREKLIGTVGLPVSGIEYVIRDGEDNKLGVGEAGEVCLRGGQATACYYKMPLDLQPVDAEGYIKTGDLGFRDADGYLHLVGRKKDIIIRGGENIVPGEIAAAVAQLDSVADVYVCGVPDELMGEKVACGVVLRAGSTFSEPEAKAALRATLARHKIPSRIIVFDAFPLLANGKLDKVGLRKLLIEKMK